tara:strand:- start:894 stop:1361 length:468 start_codon:yes stop_codon:yes gene_type:complete
MEIDKMDFNNTAIQYNIDNIAYIQMYCLNKGNNTDEIFTQIKTLIKERINKGKKYQPQIPIEEDDEGYDRRDFALEASEELLDFMVYMSSMMLRLEKYRCDNGDFMIIDDFKEQVDIDRIQREYYLLEDLIKKSVNIWVKMAELYEDRIFYEGEK